MEIHVMPGEGLNGQKPFFWGAALLLLLLLFLCSCAPQNPSTTEPEPEPVPSAAPAVQDAPAPPAAPLGPFDLVIRGGRVMDPETGYDALANVGIQGNRIVAISPGPMTGAREIDASGHVVAPGLIDIVIPRFPQPGLAENIHYWKIQDGFTTTLWLHDGHGHVADILPALQNLDHLTHWGLAAKPMTYERTIPLEQRLEYLDRSVRAGALAVSVSPEYLPQFTPEELNAFATVAARYDLPFMSHLRHSRRGLELPGVQEALDTARETGARVHMFHLNSTGGTYQMAEALEMIRSARAQGLRITLDVYPYSYWMTFINSSRFYGDWRGGFGLDYEDLFHINSASFLTQESFTRLRPQGGLVVVPEGTIPWEESTLLALQEDHVFFGSDGSFSLNPFYGGAYPSHPRDTGAGATALSLHRRFGLDLMTVIRKYTLDPARLMEQGDRRFRQMGRLQEGAFADILIFNPDTVEGRGTVQHANQLSAGIHTVIVDGVVSYTGGQVVTEGAGVFLGSDRPDNGQ